MYNPEQVEESNERKASVNQKVKKGRVVIEDDIGMWKWQFLPLLTGITAHSVSAASDLIMVRFFYISLLCCNTTNPKITIHEEIRK